MATSTYLTALSESDNPNRIHLNTVIFMLDPCQLVFFDRLQHLIMELVYPLQIIS